MSRKKLSDYQKFINYIARRVDNSNIDASLDDIMWRVRLQVKRLSDKENNHR